jgi:hypothetical protein
MDMKFIKSRKGIMGTDQVLKWIMILALLAAAGFAFRQIFLKLG